jgi:hypothetical protein
MEKGVQVGKKSTKRNIKKNKSSQTALFYYDLKDAESQCEREKSRKRWENGHMTG